MNDTHDKTPSTPERPTAPAPSMRTFIWHLLSTICAFTAAFLSFNGGSHALWAGLAGGVFMLLGHMSKPSTD